MGAECRAQEQEEEDNQTNRGSRRYPHSTQTDDPLSRTDIDDLRREGDRFLVRADRMNSCLPVSPTHELHKAKQQK